MDVMTTTVAVSAIFRASSSQNARAGDIMVERLSWRLGGSLAGTAAGKFFLRLAVVVALIGRKHLVALKIRNILL
jgi:predicted TIM-barrel enzyme